MVTDIINIHIILVSFYASTCSMEADYYELLDRNWYFQLIRGTNLSFQNPNIGIKSIFQEKIMGEKLSGKKLETLRIKPGTGGCEAHMLPMCYAVPPTDKGFKLVFAQD